MLPNNPKPPRFLYFAPPFIASQRVNPEASNLVHRRTIASPTLPMKNLPWKGRSHGQLIRFYRAMLCIRGTSHGAVSVRLSDRPSVRPSVTSRCSTKTAKDRITQTTPHDSPGSLVFCCQRSPRNSTGVTPCGGAECRWGGSKSETFDK